MSLIKKGWPFVILLSLALFLFSKLFFPPSFFSTPGDISYFHLPLKTILSDSLKDGHLPLWTNLIGEGFPIFAEGQIGTFYLPNLILFSIFSLWLAFALSYILIFLVASISTYLFTRKIGIAEIPSLFAAIAFSFSMFFISRIQHFHHIQVIALMPLGILFLELFLQTTRSRFLLFFSLVFCSQLLVGFYQPVLYSFLIYLFYFFFRFVGSIKAKKLLRRNVLKIPLFLGFFIFIAFGLSSIQLAPTYELLKNSPKSNGLNSEYIFSLSGSPKTLITLAFPYFFGNPSTGTFKPTEDLGFYWENTAYSGISTLIFAFLSIMLFFLLKKERVSFRPYIKCFILLFLGSLLFAIGKYGPFAFLFYFPPLSFFRIPSRFLFLTSFSMSILAALFLQNIYKNKKLGKFWTILFFLILVADLFYNGFSYNPTLEINNYFYTPQIAQKLNEDKSIYRITTLRYLSQPRISTQDLSWSGNNSSYLESFEALDPNVNSRFGIESLDYSTGLETNRMNLASYFLASATYIGKEGSLYFTDEGSKLINLQNVKYVLTTFQLKGTQFKELGEISPPHYDKLYLYQNLSVLPRAFIVYQYRKTKTPEETESALKDENFLPEKEVLLEQEINFQNQPIPQDYKIEIKKYKDQEIVLSTDLKEPGILVLSNSYYPGWRAFMDGKELEIMPANINQQAVIVDKGKHEITFKYDPISFKIGIAISLLSIDLLLIVYLLSKKSKRFQKFSSINA